jgi:hypothetical protein
MDAFLIPPRLGHIKCCGQAENSRPAKRILAWQQTCLLTEKIDTTFCEKDSTETFSYLVGARQGMIVALKTLD